jgi:hypothetical protein
MDIRSWISKAYQRRGIRGIFEEGWTYTLQYSPLAPFIERYFGEELNEKAAAAPALGY